MLGRLLFMFSAVAQAAVPGSAAARSDAVVGSPHARSDLNTHSEDYGYHPGRRSFYSYSRHRHVDGKRGDGGSFSRPISHGSDGSPNSDANHGSAYYGTNYGAPYFGGGYYDGGVYYRERRD
jgi:hypothetical protein